MEGGNGEGDVAYWVVDKDEHRANLANLSDEETGPHAAQKAFEAQEHERWFAMLVRLFHDLSSTIKSRVAASGNYATSTGFCPPP
jgi:hypothetical protein